MLQSFRTSVRSVTFALLSSLAVAFTAMAPQAFAASENAAQLEVINEINVNTASAEELAAALKGVGMKKAEAIVEFRTTNGKFASVDELLGVKGIGEATLNKNRSRIVL